jgi:3D (Asp-Asp-Asp) domain-containing protein
VATTQDQQPGAKRRHTNGFLAQAAIGLGLAALTAGSAVIVKEFKGSVHPLAAVELLSVSGESVAAAAVEKGQESDVPAAILAVPESTVELNEVAEIAEPAAAMDAETARFAADASVRWFNGRPIRPARTMTMTVTGYSPDSQSCGDSADGITATLHSVHTNGMKMVAADTRVLPYGSIVSVPGYDSDQIVPVLDCGGAIKGRKLDLMFPTHEAARKWGVKKLQVTVWEYADGKPMDDPRKLR